jgi:hypothetical protein
VARPWALAQTTAQPAQPRAEFETHYNGPKRKKEKKEKESFALRTLNLFLKSFNPFHYFFVSGIFASGTPLFVSNSSFNSFSFFGRQNQTTIFWAEWGGDDETEAD